MRSAILGLHAANHPSCFPIRGFLLGEIQAAEGSLRTKKGATLDKEVEHELREARSVAWLPCEHVIPVITLNHCPRSDFVAPILFPSRGSAFPPGYHGELITVARV